MLLNGESWDRLVSPTLSVNLSRDKRSKSKVDWDAFVLKDAFWDQQMDYLFDLAYILKEGLLKDTNKFFEESKDDI